MTSAEVKRIKKCIEENVLAKILLHSMGANDTYAINRAADQAQGITAVKSGPI